MALLLPSFYANTQQSFTNSGNLQIHTGASVSGFGSFTNASAGVLVNNGVFYVRGNLINDQPSMSAGNGSLHLDGSINQVIGGSQPFRAFNLVSNNGSGILLNNDLHISGVHTFTSGVVTTSATPNYLVYEAGSSYTGDGDSRHVNGWVRKIGNTNFVFPVGNGVIERAIAMNSLSAISEFNARYLANTPDSYSMTPPVWDVDETEYWAVNRISGGTASLTLNWDYAKAYFPNWIIPDIIVTGYDGSSWTDRGIAGTAGGNVTATGAITSGSISSFNLFTFGSRSYILPLMLLDFTANRQNDYTQVSWTTEKEYNMDHFIVERSDDGISFYTISRVDARNTNARESYSARDYAAINNWAYYRLRYTDGYGREKLSQVVKVSDWNAGAQLTLLTNPVSDKIELMAGGQLNGIFNYRINTMGGQLIQQGVIVIQSPGRYQLPLKESPGAGACLLYISNGRQHFYYKIITK